MLAMDHVMSMFDRMLGTVGDAVLVMNDVIFVLLGMIARILAVIAMVCLRVRAAMLRRLCCNCRNAGGEHQSGDRRYTDFSHGETSKVSDGSPSSESAMCRRRMCPQFSGRPGNAASNGFRERSRPRNIAGYGDLLAVRCAFAYLRAQNSDKGHDVSFTIRPLRSGDEDVAVGLLRELAEYERLLDRFHITRETVTRDFLCERAPINGDLLLEGERAAGIATWHWSYGSFAASRKIFLEDIFVRRERRGNGYGKALIAHLAKIARAQGGWAVEWNVLNWNKSSIDFYESIGAEAITGWIGYSLHGEALERLAQ